MVYCNDNKILSLGAPIEGREFTRYFSGFPLISQDQEIIAYHKKHFIKKHRKDIGSGVEIFVCRDKVQLKEAFADFFAICKEYGQLMIRDNAIYGMQVHIPLTGERMGNEDMYMKIINGLWKEGYVVVSTVMQTKDFPLIQRSITDPTLLIAIVSHGEEIANSAENPTIANITSLERRDRTIADLTTWCEENDYNTELLDSYDIALIRCDT